MSMREILCHIYGLMMCPDMDTPIDGYDESFMSKINKTYVCIIICLICRTLADQYGYFRYHNDHLPKKFFGEADKYFDEAKKWVKTNATKSFEELCKVSVIIIQYFIIKYIHNILRSLKGLPEKVNAILENRKEKSILLNIII